jgi:hypothetical protein
MTTSDKMSQIRRVLNARVEEKSADDMTLAVEFSTMSNEMKNICIERARDALSKIYFCNIYFNLRRIYY